MTKNKYIANQRKNRLPEVDASAISRKLRKVLPGYGIVVRAEAKNVVSLYVKYPPASVSFKGLDKNGPLEITAISPNTKVGAIPLPSFEVMNQVDSFDMSKAAKDAVRQMVAAALSVQLTNIVIK